MGYTERGEAQSIRHGDNDFGDIDGHQTPASIKKHPFQNNQRVSTGESLLHP